MSGLIAVHVGAGYHGENRRPYYLRVCKQACSAATEMLKEGSNAVEAITEAVSILEDCPMTNAGIGSNLTFKGSVECDAGIMDGASLNFGSVGALPNIKNPIKVARKILEEQRNGLLCDGRIAPSTIVGQGALDYALEHGFNFIDVKQLLTENSEKTFTKNKSMVVRLNSSSLTGNPESESCEKNLLDTVGAICVDSSGNVASCASSGGLILKCPGRIGQAAIYGAGCWAQNSLDISKPSIACTVTGAGEYLVKTIFAKECYKHMYERHNCMSALHDVFRDRYLDSPYLRNVTSKLAGVLTLSYRSPENFCGLSWAHNTRTMVLAFESTIGGKYSTVSMQPENALSDTNIVGSEQLVMLN